MLLKYTLLFALFYTFLSGPQVEDVCVFSRNDFFTVSNGQLNVDLTTASLYNVLILDGIKCTVAFELLLLDAFACRGTYWPAVHHSKVSSASKSFSKILILLLLLVSGNVSTQVQICFLKVYISFQPP